MKHPRRGHHTHHFVLSYPVSLGDKLYTFFVGPLAVVILIALVVNLYPPSTTNVALEFPTILLSVLATMLRLAAAYALSVVVAVPLALLAERSQHIETLLLPVYDVFESIPNLAVLPVLVVFFLRFNFLDGAAVGILFLSMIWNIVFALIGGLKVIPKDVKAAATLFGMRGWSYVRGLIMPAIFPQFVTGSILAVAQGWNIIIVAEALHVYAPAGSSVQDLFGIGSLLVSTSTSGHGGSYLLVFIVMVAVIALFNIFVWQKLLNYSQRFRFE